MGRQSGGGAAQCRPDNSLLDFVIPEVHRACV